MTPYDLEIRRIIKNVKSRGARRVMIQAPDGLKQYLADLCRELEKADVLPIISADPCYGACDLATREASITKADLLIHVGHVKFKPGKDEMYTIYVPARHLAELGPLGEKAGAFLNSKGIKRVGLVANTQHHEYLQEFGKALSKFGVKAVIDKQSRGLILGCRVEAAKRIEGEVDAFVYLGGGDFHGLGAALAVEKQVYIADPYRGEVRDLEKLKRKILAKRWWTIKEALDAKTFGIVIVSKTGQFEWQQASALKSGLEKHGRTAFLIIVDDVNWERIAPFTFVDAFIVTGCPRIALDNQDSFAKPVLGMEDAQELLKRVHTD